jgi:hypothetical protein
MAPLCLGFPRPTPDEADRIFSVPAKKNHCERIGEFLNNHSTKQNASDNHVF